MTLVADFARLIEAFVNDEHVEAPRDGAPLIARGARLDAALFAALTPTCTLVEREQVLAQLPTWAQRAVAR
jgi:hypothetical protein